MKTITKLTVCLILTLSGSVVLGEENDKVIPSKNKFSERLSEYLRSQLTFEEQEESIRIEAKPKATLPLEFVAGKGLEASDGVLSVGDSFAWPGCGFDRTSYTVREITPQFVLVEYSRGMPQQDGYQDSGEIKISFGKQK